MDSRFLQTLVCVAEVGSIAEAARRLDLAPSSVSQQLRALEAIVGTALVSRVGRTVRPTVAGARVVGHARDVLREVGNLKSAATDGDLPAGPFRIGATPSALIGIMPTLLKAWCSMYPGIAAYIEPGPSTRLYARILDGELDAAVLVSPLFELPKTCEWHPLREEELILVTTIDLDASDPLEVIRREPYIRYDRSVVGGKLADDYLRQRGIEPNVRFELDGIDPIARLVAEGLGVSLLPDWAVIGPPDSRLARWKLPPPRPKRTIGLIWQRSSVRSPLAKAFSSLADRFLQR